MAPHGATGLLNELLAEQAALVEPQEQESLEPQPQERDEEVAQEIRALHEEMDDCLASLAQWRQEREREREVMEREFEAKCAAQLRELQAERFEEDDQATRLEEEDEAHSSGAEDAEPMELAEAKRPAPAACPAMPSTIAPPQATEADSRLASLRAEVEALRRKEAEVERRFMADAANSEEVLEASPPGGLGLTQWCAEVDAALGQDAGSSGALEEQMLKARERVGATEGALELAGNRLEGELSELERMLADCSALQARARAAAGA
eukprot:TRINITY_DN8012_c0_g1_i1.p1 TRINITY_DN8012_c0_g1~~TRINITY_DN8012_c0_g1_i1.p1  ORF type:complete len:266 (+),score=107.09 TRINITY_DN8012_c0_g1_i1:43-840(+)